MRGLTLVCSALLALSSCDDEETAADAAIDAGSEVLLQDASTPLEVGDLPALEALATCEVSPTPPQYPFECFYGSAGVCSDQAEPPVCVSGQWQCGTTPSGMPKLRTDQCRCFINPTPPGQVCDCTDAGRQCRPTDAGSDG